MIHDLKIFPEYFSAVNLGLKKFEIRKNDRNFSVGDILFLNEFDGINYTGRSIQKKVCYMLLGGNFGLQNDYVIMSLCD